MPEPEEQGEILGATVAEGRTWSDLGPAKREQERDRQMETQNKRHRLRVKWRVSLTGKWFAISNSSKIHEKLGKYVLSLLTDE